MSEKVQVEDFKNLYRDSNSKAIINSNNDEYTKYMQAYNRRKKSKEKLDNTVDEINIIKQDMSEMKDILRQLLENKTNGN